MKNQKQIADKFTTLTRDLITMNTVTKNYKNYENKKKRDVIVMTAGTRKDK